MAPVISAQKTGFSFLTFHFYWMDGKAEKNESKDTIYNFVSDYGKEDIIYTLEELFPSKNFSLLSRVRSRPLQADHECTVALMAIAGQSFIWPEMIGIQAQVCREVHRTNQKKGFHPHHIQGVFIPTNPIFPY